MAYRRPGIRVTQEFLDLQPALAAFNLPNCIIGPAYQVVQNDSLGSYVGVASSYSYVGLGAGNIVDVAELDELELADHQYPISVTLQNVKVELLAKIGTGYVESTDLLLVKEDSLNVFSEVVAGDEIEILEDTVEIVAAQTNGTAAVANADRLVTPTTGLFADVAAGDKVTISSGTDVTTGEYTVSSKIDDETLVLDASFYIGGTSTADIAYRVDRITGVNNQGVYVIREVVDNNSLKLQGELAEAETLLSFRILRTIDEVTLERGTHFDADADSIDIHVALEVDGNDIVEADVYANYRALRVDLTSTIRDYADLASVQAVFGIDQIVPANPLAFGIALALQNTVTKVNGLGLGASFLTNETLAYQAAIDTLKKSSMYALCPLTQSPVVHQLFSTHVTQISNPDLGKERVAIVNRKLITTETVVDSKTTNGTRVIVNTQTGGLVTLGADTLSAVSALFTSVQAGDVVVIVSGTGVVAGSYVVESVDSDTQLTLGDGFVATYNGADVAYYITRADGLEANGVTFYDGTATFVTSGVAAGHYLVIESGGYAGTYAVTSVLSQTKLTVVQVPGVLSVQAPLTYSIYRNMTGTEIAEFMKGYAAAFGNRRFVITFPDTVKIPEGSVIRELPGFYLGCAIAALTTGLPTQQGFTNLSISGFLGFVNGSDLFDEEQLDIIADGGVMIFDQEVPEAPLFCRHELTTDRSSVKFQEYMVTKNVDFIAKFMRNSFKDFIGQYNIVDATYDALKTRAGAVLTFLRDDTVVPRFGGVIKSGTLTQLQEGTNIDSIDMRFRLDIPVPLNNLNITIQV